MYVFAFFLFVVLAALIWWCELYKGVEEGFISWWDEDLDNFRIIFVTQQTPLHSKRMEVSTYYKTLRHSNRKERTLKGSAVDTWPRLFGFVPMIGMRGCAHRRNCGMNKRFRTLQKVYSRKTFGSIGACSGIVLQVHADPWHGKTLTCADIPMEKHMAIPLYRLATSAEDRTVESLWHQPFVS